MVYAMTIPFIDFGGSGEKLVFLHANGYPPECYRPLLSRLAEKYHVTAMVQRPLWHDNKPEDIDDWRPLTEDFLHFLETHQSEPVACVGHSMGGTALLRAALREPERFQAIVLLDPVLFPRYLSALWTLLYKSGLGYRLHPLVTATKKRRQEFDDLDKAFKGFRRKPIFRYMDDDTLHAYVEGITCLTDRGSYRLCYSAEWEMRLYVTAVWRDMDIWRGLSKLQVPTLIIRGAETDTFREQTGKLVKQKQPKARIETLARSTHLVPLERPIDVSNLIQAFLEENV